MYKLTESDIDEIVQYTNIIQLVSISSNYRNQLVKLEMLVKTDTLPNYRVTIRSHETKNETAKEFGLFIQAVEFYNQNV